MSREKYEISDFAFIGRTFAEYQQMFDLDIARRAGQRILDCPSGPCSFVAEANEHGIETIGVDKMFNRSPATLSQICSDDIDTTIAAMEGVEDLYQWEFYEDVSGLTSYREQAASRFLYDYAQNGERYVYGNLPDLPFSDGAFDLVLSAHFLFLYDDRLSHDFHLETIQELLRVSDQLRLFPLYSFDAEESGFVESLVQSLRSDHYSTDIRSVSFEFQRGADKMLVVE